MKLLQRRRKFARTLEGFFTVGCMINRSWGWSWDVDSHYCDADQYADHIVHISYTQAHRHYIWLACPASNQQWQEIFFWRFFILTTLSGAACFVCKYSLVMRQLCHEDNWRWFTLAGRLGSLIITEDLKMCCWRWSVANDEGWCAVGKIVWMVAVVSLSDAWITCCSHCLQSNCTLDLVQHTR